MSVYLVTGAGPVGRAVARRLHELGHRAVVMSRGSRPDALESTIEHRRGDASNPADYPDGIAGIAHCIHAAYDARIWRELLVPAEQTALEVARQRDVPIVFPESVYAFDKEAQVVTPATPLTDSRSGKPGVRADLLKARAASGAQAFSVVASDLYGPDAGAGCIVHQLIIGRKRPFALINDSVAHAVTYLPDLARMIVDALLATTPLPRIMVAPTAPAVTQRQLAEMAGCEHRPFVITPWMVKLGGVFDFSLRGLVEMLYLWERPADVDGSVADWKPTAIEVGLEACLRDENSSM